MSRKVEYGMCCWCVQGTNISSLESVDMLFKFIKPLVEEGEDDDDMDEEVRHPEMVVSPCSLFCCPPSDTTQMKTSLVCAVLAVHCGNETRLISALLQVTHVLTPCAVGQVELLMDYAACPLRYHSAGHGGRASDGGAHAAPADLR
jgi:hypothetical protein